MHADAPVQSTPRKWLVVVPLGAGVVVRCQAPEVKFSARVRSTKPVKTCDPTAMHVDDVGQEMPANDPRRTCGVAFCTVHGEVEADAVGATVRTEAASAT